MKTRNKRKVLLVVLVLGILALGGGYAGYRGYKSIRQAHLIKQAQHYLTKSDAKKALLCLQRVLRSNPRNVEACRLMAELSEAGRSPGALLWRSRVVELNPRSLDDRLALAQSAMMFRDYELATNALDGVDAAGKKTAAYYNIAGVVASTVGQFAQAEAHFLEAARLEPTNPAPQLNLAVVRLHSTNTSAIAEARTTLTRISSSSSALRCQALRELVVDSMRSRQTNAALELSRNLVQQTNSIFSDRLLRLDVLKGSQNAEFKPALAAFQREAGTNTANIYELSIWQMTRIGPAETLAWLRSLPRNMQTNQPVALLAAECYTMLRDWRGLQNSLKQQDWAELGFVRHAFQTRALRGQDLPDAAKAEWDMALKTANGQKASLVMLLRLAAQWGWQSEGEDLLWTIVNQYPGEKWAFVSLNQALFVDGRTRSLMMLYSQQLKRSPSDLSVKNNLAMTALLLDAQELKPHELAREVYEKAPTNADYVSTYAFSLHMQKKDTEALKVIEQLKPRDLENPSIAGYYGLILKATGNGAKAKPYLEWAFKSPLLPEERKLFEKAKAGI
jgi:tetratricopeptide (TPR) repeat protein